MSVNLMSAEQFLNSIRHLDNEIDALDLARVRLADQRQDILDRAENISANLSGVCVQQSMSSKTETLGIELANTMNIERLINKISEYREMINTKIDLLVDYKMMASTLIEYCSESKHRALLTYRFVNSLKWSIIADLMCYTEDYVRNGLREEAIREFERVWDKSKKSTLF